MDGPVVEPVVASAGHNADEQELHRRLARYQSSDHLFREKYGMNLAEFETAQVVKQQGYSFEVENDHQDWDQAVDGIPTIERQLAALLAQVNSENVHREVDMGLAVGGEQW